MRHPDLWIEHVADDTIEFMNWRSVLSAVVREGVLVGSAFHIYFAGTPLESVKQCLPPSVECTASH
jgi:hypothetical protein